MAADDLEYGWYKWENGFRQKDGFFVDRAGNILYWPTRKGPGHLMDERSILMVSKASERGKYDQYPVIVLCLLLSAGVYYFFDLKEFFGSLGSFLFLPMLVVGFGLAVIPRRDRSVDLSHRPTLPMPSPPVNDGLIAAKALSPTAFRSRVGLILLATGVMAYIGVDNLDSVLSWKPSADFGSFQRYICAVWSLVGFVLAAACPGHLIVLIRARNSPYSLDHLVSRIKEREGLTLEALQRVSDDDPVPEEGRLSAERLKEALDKAYRNNRGL